MSEQNIKDRSPFGYGGNTPRDPSQPDWANREPYPPRHADELRLTALLERIEARLKRIETKLGIGVDD